MKRLKPCPFCGNEATILAQDGKHGIFAYVQCTFCSASSRRKCIGSKDEDLDDPKLFKKYAVNELIAAWNMRHKENG